MLPFGRRCGRIGRHDPSVLSHCLIASRVWSRVPRRGDLRGSSAGLRSPTSRRRLAFTSVTTAARSGRSTCPRRWDPAARSWTWTTTDGRTSSSSTRRTGRARREHRHIPRSITTIATERSPTSRGRRAWRSRCTAWASPPATTTTTATSISTSQPRSESLVQESGQRQFEDVTAKAGVGDPGFSTSAMWFDYDKDGKLDLFVAQLRRLDAGEGPVLLARRQDQVVLHAGVVQGQSPTLYHNRGNGTFEDVTRRPGSTIRRRKASASPCSTTTATAGPISSSPTTRSRTSCIATRRTARSKTSAMTAGVAFNEAGVARAGMGVDAADYDGSGRPSLVIGNFSNEMIGALHQQGNGLFIDEAPSSAIGKASLLTLTFALLLLRRGSRRTARHLRRQRSRRRRHQPRPAEGHLRRAGASVQNLGGRGSRRSRAGSAAP